MFDPNPQSLAEVLITLMSSPNRLRQLSAGLDGFAESMSLESFGDRLRDILISRLKLQPVNRLLPARFHEATS
jgi:hypothetical protein